MIKKLLNEALYNLIFNEWGTSKTFKVIGVSITCGAIGSILGASFIENVPKNKCVEQITEKEND